MRALALVAWGMTMLAVACSSSPSAPLGGDRSDSEPEPDDASSPPPRDASPPPRDAGSSTDAGTTLDAGADADVDAAGPSGPFACAAEPGFPASVNLPEASAVAEVELMPGVRQLLLVSDSGNAGAALLLPIPSATSIRITLPLDSGANDDLEGIAWRGGKLYTLTSSGAVRRFTPDGSGGLRRDQDAYPLGAPPHACSDLQQVNCGRNYEGLCLRAAGSSAPCAGYAASRADGKLYCLELDANGVLSASTTRPPIDTGVGQNTLSDCAFGAAGGPAEDVLVIATNIYGFSKTYRVDEATGAKRPLPTAFLPNLEATTIDRDGALYTFSDDNSTEASPGNRLLCRNW